MEPTPFSDDVTAVLEQLAAERAVSQPGKTSSDPLHYPGWDNALTRLRAVIAERAIAMLVGLPGVGKTTMLRSLETESGPAWHWRKRRTQPILVDDAHLLTAPDLAAVLAQRSARILAGPHGLVQRLGSIRAHVEVIELPPLHLQDHAAVLHEMLRRSGEADDVLPSAAIVALTRHAAGRVGRLETLAKLSIFLARLEGAAAVQADHVEEAAAVSVGVDLADPKMPDVEPHDSARPHRPVRPGLLAFAALGALIAVPSRLAMDGTPPGATTVQPIAEVRPPILPAPLPPPARTLPPLPLQLPLHVTVLVAPGNLADADRGRRVVDLLVAAGYDAVVQTTPSGFVPAFGIRYGFVNDRMASLVLAGSLGGAYGEPRQLEAAFAELPRPGSVEIGLPLSAYVPQRSRLAR